MRRMPALVAALLLPSATSFFPSTAVSISALLVAQSPARAQSAEAVAKVAQAITVRIEGATEGSGVLVQRVGNRYTVLTAWHVVSGQRPGEELEIFTPDGQRHQAEQDRTKRIANDDLATISFLSGNTYPIAPLTGPIRVSIGELIFVSGFPLQAKEGASGNLRFKQGMVEGIDDTRESDGNWILYSSSTLPGMSGGPVLDINGSLVAVHGKGEVDIKLSEDAAIAVKTGTNKGVLIDSWLKFAGLSRSSISAETPRLSLRQANSEGAS